MHLIPLARLHLVAPATSSLSLASQPRQPRSIHFAPEACHQNDLTPQPASAEMETIRFARSLLLALALSPLQSKADSPAARLEPARLDGVALGAQAEVLYDCRFKYAQLPPSFIKLSILHLLDERGADPAGLPMETISSEASMGELSSSRLDPSLPFIFFINGFNNREYPKTTIKLSPLEPCH